MDSQVRPSSNPIIQTKTMTLANTEYSLTLPKDTKKFTIKTRDLSEFRLAFVTGKVASSVEPFFTFNAGISMSEDMVLLPDTTGVGTADTVIYFASGDAGKIIELITWS